MLFLLSSDIHITKIMMSLHLYTSGIGFHHPMRPNHGILLNIRGTLVFDYFEIGETITVGPGMLAYLPQGYRYTITKFGDNEAYLIDFLLDMPLQHRCTVQTLHAPESFVSPFQNAARQWKRKTPGYMHKAMSCLYEILYLLEKEYSINYFPSAYSQQIQPALDYIASNYNKECVSVAALAQLCGLSQTYFRKLFHCVFGIAPKLYIQNLKINRAQELLQSGMYGVEQTAYLCGYSDCSIFSREFKKMVGMSPSTYKMSFFVEEH